MVITGICARIAVINMIIKQINNALLIQGDCLEIMPMLPILCGANFDLLLTDPAYKTISGGNTASNGPTGILKANDGKIFKYNDIDISEWAAPVYDLMKDPSHIYIMTNFLNLFRAADIMRLIGFQLHNLLIWEKNNVTPNRWYMKNVEYILFGRKGAAFPINEKGSKTSTHFKNIKGEKLHPTEKPLSLMAHYISNSTQPGDTVFDPFMGSGTTGLACQRMGRKFVGIEIDPEYFQVAFNRISAG